MHIIVSPEGVTVKAGKAAIVVDKGSFRCQVRDGGQAYPDKRFKIRYRVLLPKGKNQSLHALEVIDVETNRSVLDVKGHIDGDFLVRLDLKTKARTIFFMQIIDAYAYQCIQDAIVFDTDTLEPAELQPHVRELIIGTLNS